MSKVGESRGNAGKGRRKGSRNKTTLAVKEAIEQAFHRLGGVEGLVAWANTSNDNLTVFYEKMLMKLLPIGIDLNKPPAAPPPPALDDPAVFEAALALDTACADAARPRAPGPPPPHMGSVPPVATAPPAPTLDEATPVPTGASEGGPAV